MTQMSKESEHLTGRGEFIMPDLHRVRAWILWNGMGLGNGSVHFYGFDGTESVYRFAGRGEQNELVNRLILRDNGEEQRSAFADKRPFRGYASGPTAGNWYLAAKQFSNFLFYRERDLALFFDTHLGRPSGPVEWVRLLEKGGL